MTNHDFSFEGGKLLKYMGATWFVSYAYYEHIDNSHKNWEKVSTSKSRIHNYHKGQQYHKAWLQYVLSMNEKNLSKNTIGVSPSETKRMARELLIKAFK